MNVKRIALASIITWIVGTAIKWLTCGWLFSWVYMMPPNIWKSPEVMMSPTYMILGNIGGLIVSALFVIVFAIIFKGIPGKGAQKGAIYGVLIWLVASVGGIALMPLYMTVSGTVVVYWIVQALAINLINGAIVGALYMPKK